VPERRCF
jgi:hypothetical protein